MRKSHKNGSRHIIGNYRMPQWKKVDIYYLFAVAVAHFLLKSNN